MQALRHCDGGRAQCVVLVRDNFWLAASRFMQDLEVRLVEGENSALVDLFGPLHTRKSGGYRLYGFRFSLLEKTCARRARILRTKTPMCRRRRCDMPRQKNRRQNCINTDIFHHESLPLHRHDHVRHPKRAFRTGFRIVGEDDKLAEVTG